MGGPAGVAQRWPGWSARVRGVRWMSRQGQDGHDIVAIEAPGGGAGKRPG